MSILILYHLKYEREYDTRHLVPGTRYHHVGRGGILHACSSGPFSFETTEHGALPSIRKTTLYPAQQLNLFSCFQHFNSILPAASCCPPAPYQVPIHAGRGFRRRTWSRSFEIIDASMPPDNTTAHCTSERVQSCSSALWAKGAPEH